ncbi:GNAT family N-acetyltransferase [Actinomadura latina]|uniref:GNAT family N-acetyltransferase n=1 Tax=Actinomadura latina TaxID=163603 RepID=A0A846YXB4_9ACTN|nr:GNAT family N-acetyltransferase [Actinomadura latina]NKZ05139.1 GNAT family N-acetyltransferase [Actinomadura latina]
MGWTLTNDLDGFLAHAGGFLRGDPVANTVPLTVTEAMRVQGSGLYGDALLGWWTADGRVAGACLWTGAHPPMLTAMPETAAAELAETLAGRDATVPGINGSPEAAEAFADAWTRRTRAASGVAMRQRLYRLDGLDVPDPQPEGAARVAGGGDRELALEWFTAFHADAGEPRRANPELVDGRLAAGGLMLWETGGGPVAMAGRTAVVAGMARVAPVYTPARHRRRGYGAAVTAAVTQGALDAGAEHVVLFTDLANPTSNGIYQRLGYRPVQDRVVLSFT